MRVDLYKGIGFDGNDYEDMNDRAAIDLKDILCSR